MTRMAVQSASSAASVQTPRARRGGLWLATTTLWRREMVRFFRQYSRVVSAVAMPLIFWLFLGSGLNSLSVAPPTDGAVGLANPVALQPASVGYRQYFFPGTVVLMLLNTAIFSTITVIEDRREGFMQGVLVAPVPRLAIVLGKVFGGAGIATVQGLIFLLVWPLVGGWPGLGWMLLSLGVMALLALALTGLCFCIAWPMESTSGFHAIMMLFLMPMWFLSGAVFPVDRAPLWLRLLMWADPLTYGQAVFSHVLTAGQTSVGAPVSPAVAALLTAVFTLGVLLLAAKLISRPRRDGTL